MLLRWLLLLSCVVTQPFLSDVRCKCMQQVFGQVFGQGQPQKYATKNFTRVHAISRCERHLIFNSNSVFFSSSVYIKIQGLSQISWRHRLLKGCAERDWTQGKQWVLFAETLNVTEAKPRETLRSQLEARKKTAKKSFALLRLAHKFGAVWKSTTWSRARLKFMLWFP